MVATHGTGGHTAGRHWWPHWQRHCGRHWWTHWWWWWPALVDVQVLWPTVVDSSRQDAGCSWPAIAAAECGAAAPVLVGGTTSGGIFSAVSSAPAPSAVLWYHLRNHRRRPRAAYPLRYHLRYHRRRRRPRAAYSLRCPLRYHRRQYCGALSNGFENARALGPTWRRAAPVTNGRKRILEPSS